MNIYKYSAKDINGVNISGRHSAQSPSQLIIDLRDKGLYVVNYKIVNESSKFNLNSVSILNSKRLSLKDIAYMCKQFSVIISAGISMAEGIEILQEESINKNLKGYLAKMKGMIFNGESLSNSMRQLGNIFPVFMINMIAVGEESGKLDTILIRLSIYYEKQVKVKGKTINALIYPLVVFIVSIIVMIFLMIKVVPIFAENLLSSGGKLPFITVLVLAISDFLTSKYYIIILTIMFFVLICLCIKDKSFYKRKKDMMKLSVPVTKKIYIKLISSRFASTLSMLIGSGIPVVRSLDIAAQLLDNTLIEEKLKKCTIGINNGESLSSVIKGLNMFPKLLCSMIKIGEETGSIEELLYKVSEVFEEEAYESINKATVLIEPVMICFLSVMVGVIIATTMFPMLDMMNVMGN